MKKIDSDRLIFWACISTVIALFICLFRMNHYFSKNFDVLALLSIDEVVYQLNLLRMRNDMAGDYWQQALANTNYGYGNIFWTPLTLLTWPAAKWGPEWLTIVIPRYISTIALGFCFIALYLIARARDFDRAQAMAFLLIPATFAEIYFITPLFHNHTLLAALFLWSLYFLILPPTRGRKTMACLLCGIMIGLKLVGLFGLPVFFLFWNRHLSLKSPSIFSRKVLRSNILAAALITVTAIIAFSPTVLLLPFNNMIFVDESVARLKYFLIELPKLYPPPHQAPLATDLWKHAIQPFMHWALLAMALSACLFSIARKKARKIDDVLLPLAALLSMLVILSIFAFSNREPFFSRSHILPFLFILPMGFLGLSRQAGLAVLFIIVASSNLFLKFNDVTSALFTNRENGPEMVKEYARLDILKNLPHPDNEIIYLDEDILLPLGSLANYFRVRYVFNQTYSVHDDGDAYVMRKSLPIPPELLKSPFTIVYADNDIVFVRRRTQ